MLSYFTESAKVYGGRTWACPCSSFSDSVEVDIERTWAFPCIIFTWDAVGVEIKQISMLRPSLRTYHHGGEDMSSNTRGT